MDIKKVVYPVSNSWFGKIEITDIGAYDLSLFTKYAEPTIDVGGSFVDGTTSYSLTSVTKRVYNDSPFAQEFNPTTLGVSLNEAGKRATAFVNVLATRIETAMDTVRAVDGTSSEATSWKVV